MSMKFLGTLCLIFMQLPAHLRASFLLRDFLHPLESMNGEISVSNCKVQVLHGKVQLRHSFLHHQMWYSNFVGWFQESIENERLLPKQERLYSTEVLQSEWG